MVSERGIKANPEKIQAIINKKSPKTLNEVQRLAKRIVALNKFVSKSIDKFLPFFQVLWKVHE